MEGAGQCYYLHGVGWMGRFLDCALRAPLEMTGGRAPLEMTGGHSAATKMAFRFLDCALRAPLEMTKACLPGL